MVGSIRRIATAAVAVAAASSPALFAVSPASAAVSNCSHGYVSATKAWGTCTSGSGSWSLTVQCYLWGANTALRQRAWKYLRNLPKLVAHHKYHATGPGVTPRDLRLIANTRR